MFLDGPTDVREGGSLAVVNAGLLRHLHGPARRVYAVGRESLRSVRPDVWLSHFWTGLGACWTTPPEHVRHWVVLADWEGHAGPPPERWREVLADPRFRCLVVPSDHSRRLFCAAGWPGDALRVLPYGVDTRVFRPRGRGESRTFQALFVGGLLERKGVRELYEAWRLAFRPDEPVRLVLKAQGEQTFYRGQFIEPPGDLPGLGKVIRDDLDTEEMASLYQTSDVVVQPYRHEGFCLPLLEAMACGVPVVYPEYGPAPEFVPEGAGVRVPGVALEVATHALARALRYLYERPVVRRAMGESGARAAQAYSWERVAMLWTVLLREVCGV